MTTSDASYQKPGFDLEQSLRRHRNFLEKQQGIIERDFDYLPDVKTPISPASNIITQGYLIALRHPPALTELVESFAKKVGEVVPSLVYTKEMMHSTIATYGILKEYFTPKEETLNNLVALTADRWKKPDMHYEQGRYGHNKETLIINGNPDRIFTDIVFGIANSNTALEGVVKPAWGSHMTLNRFTEPRSLEQMKELLHIYTQAPKLPNTIPTHIDVGVFIWDAAGFKFDVYKSVGFK